jgi:hypothetical protein
VSDSRVEQDTKTPLPPVAGQQNRAARQLPEGLDMKYLLEIAGIVLMAAAALILLHDLYRLYQQSDLILNHQPRPAAIEPRYVAAGQITAVAIVCLLAGVGA